MNMAENRMGAEGRDPVFRFILWLVLSTILVCITAFGIILVVKTNSDARVDRIQEEIGSAVTVSDLSDATIVAADRDSLWILGRNENGTYLSRTYDRRDPRLANQGL